MSTAPTMSRRIFEIGICTASLAVCVLLAWWQWGRYSSVGGNWQNLGYVLQWPLFGLFPAFVFWRMRKLRRDHEADGDAVPLEPPRPVQSRPQPTDHHDELAAYNRYLAQLHGE